MAKIKITLVKSRFGRIKTQTATLQALGLKKIGSSVVMEDSAATLGMINKVSHLVEVEEIMEV